MVPRKSPGSHGQEDVNKAVYQFFLHPQHSTVSLEQKLWLRPRHLQKKTAKVVGVMVWVVALGGDVYVVESWSPVMS